MQKKSLFVGSVLAGMAMITVVAQPAEAVDYRAPEVRSFEIQQGGIQQSAQVPFYAFDPASEDGGTVALGDVNGDGVDEIIVGAGPGSQPEVRIYNEVGILQSSFLVYAEHVNIGVNVASGDLNNDGTDEIVIGSGRGGGPQVRVFDMNGDVQFTPGFFAYAEGFRGGVNVAVGNIDGKGGDEIITGAGPGGGPHVRVFNRYGNYVGVDFFPFADTDNGGVSVAAANVDGGDDDEVVTAIHSFGEPWVKVYKADGSKTIVGEFVAYDKSHKGGVNVTGADIDKDGKDEIITSVRQGGASHIRLFEKNGRALSSGFFAYEDEFRGGVSIAAGNIDADGKVELVTIPQKKIVEGRMDLFKYIDVDLSEQTIRVYRNGVKENEFLTSTGVWDNPTPTGEFSVRRKIPLKDYISLDQDKASAAYYETLENVHWNLEFLPHYYLHEAYWHNNFGNPMSHGCVNLSYDNSKWLYDWADVGDTVIIH